MKDDDLFNASRFDLASVSSEFGNVSIADWAIRTAGIADG
jgi:hypothetical protein